MSSYARSWLAAKSASGRIGPGTERHYRDTLATRILPMLGHLDAADITRPVVDQWRERTEGTRRSDGSLYARSTLDGWWRVLRCLLRDMAADHGTPDPTRRVVGPTSVVKGRRDTRSLDDADSKKLWEALASAWPEWFVELRALALTGVRAGELRAWTIRDYMPEFGLLLVVHAVKRDNSVGNAKTEKGAILGCPQPTVHDEHCICRGSGFVRAVPVVPELRQLLDQHLKVLKGRGLSTPSSPLFPAADGGRRGRGSHYKVLRLAAAACGISMRVGTHTLRRTLNTQMVAAGVPIQNIQGTMGHVTDQMTGHYNSPTITELARSVEKAQQS